MEDSGYVRRSISNQQEFIMNQLDFLRVSGSRGCVAGVAVWHALLGVSSCKVCACVSGLVAAAR